MIGTISMRPRQGFTLIELLVATGVFMLGFTAAFSLFLAAMRYRVLADDTTKLSLAASSLVEELAIGNPNRPTSPWSPSDYVGDGKLPLFTPINGDFAAYPGIPGTWYRVETCTDLLGQNNQQSPTLHMNLLVLVDTQSNPNQPLTLEELNRRLRLLTPANGWRGNLSNPEKIDVRDALVKRGLAMRISTVVVRRPNWM